MEDFVLLQNKKFKDKRGFFYESFSKSMQEELNTTFVQDNISFSKKGVIRGLHYQWEEPMGKLVHVVSGQINDYIVDIRKNSKNLGKCYCFNLTSDNGNILWVPPGFAHGFEALTDSYVMYKCSSYYNKDFEGGINLFDKKLNIKFTNHAEDIIISKRDQELQSFDDYCSKFRF